MKKKYEKPIMEITAFESEDIITVSSNAGLINGGNNGSAMKSSFDSLFGK